jgi:hypothetical protein
MQTAARLAEPAVLAELEKRWSVIGGRWSEEAVRRGGQVRLIHFAGHRASGLVEIVGDVSYRHL